MRRGGADPERAHGREGPRIYNLERDMEPLISLKHLMMSEEYVQDGRMTIALNKYSEICAVDFPGGCRKSQDFLIERLVMEASSVNLTNSFNAL